MADYFEVKVSFDKMQDNGTVKKVSEPYLIDAMSFTEAESRALEKVTPLVNGEVTVKTCKRTNISEIVNPQSDNYYLAKVAFIAYNEVTAKSTRTVVQMLVGANDFRGACDEINDHMKGCVSDWTLQSLSVSPIIDVFCYE